MPNSLPNLSTWNRVPIGATIPAGTPYAFALEGTLMVKRSGYPVSITVRDGAHTYYTEHPVTTPLPTEDGATILVSDAAPLAPHTLLTREDGRWFNRSGGEWRVNQITAWAPVTIGEVVVMP